MADRINPFETRNPEPPHRPNLTLLAGPQAFKTARPIDDVIAHLANATENRRARQIGEWERLQRNTYRVSA